MREKVACPFCDNGCCFCDYEGFVFVGENEEIKSRDFVKSLGVQYLREADKQVGGLENDREMLIFFLKDENVPKSFKRIV